ncbi:ladinin-1 [Lepus europaeus]|uniref:ladinin-1 n=1 Tax=Lepus europaeus TaxID=9983 RepID=UPI002B4606F8|nr:ladinin-1 [Lepus europaeus]
MSVGRKNWSALSSLARQRTLEDEEEQERERRRRHRNLSSTTEEESPRFTQNGEQRAAERLPSVEEAEAPPPPPPAPKDEDEDVQAILRSRKERRQRQRQQPAEAAPQAPVQERPEAEAGRDSVDAGRAAQQPPVPRKEPEPPPRQRLSREQRGLWAQGEEESSAGKKEVLEKTPALEKAPVPEEKTLAPEKRLVSEQSSVSGQPPVPEKSPRPGKSAEPQKRGVQEVLLEEKSVSEKAPARPAGSGGRRVLERASIFEKPLLSDKSPATEAKPAPKRAAASEQGAPAGSPATAKAPVPPPGASRLPPITLQVKIPSREEEADASSPSQLTYSSSLKRSSPRTISFRMSPRKDNSETTLTRSASVRLPASSARLGEKLERYHTAIQRSESVRSSGSSRAEVFVAPAGVASKRHLFEKELVGQSRPEPASSRKENLRLSGVVTSKLNLWISRTQESGEQDPQEVRREVAATKRTQRGKKPEASLEAEV